MKRSRAPPVENVQFGILEQGGSVAEMMLLHDGARIEGGQRCLSLRHVKIGVTAMIDIVAKRADEERQTVQCRQLMTHSAQNGVHRLRNLIQISPCT